jgi:hypothetical protein
MVKCRDKIWVALYHNFSKPLKMYMLAHNNIVNANTLTSLHAMLFL